MVKTFKLTACAVCGGKGPHLGQHGHKYVASKPRLELVSLVDPTFEALVASDKTDRFIAAEDIDAFLAGLDGTVFETEVSEADILSSMG